MSRGPRWRRAAVRSSSGSGCAGACPSLTRLRRLCPRPLPGVHYAEPWSLRVRGRWGLVIGVGERGAYREEGGLLLRCAVGERAATPLVDTGESRAGVLGRMKGVVGGFMEPSRAFPRLEVGGDCLWIHIRRRAWKRMTRVGCSEMLTVNLASLGFPYAGEAYRRGI